MYSGGEIGCDGPLPAAPDGENEIYAQIPGAAGMRRTDTPRYATPAYPGPVQQLPAHYRVSEMDGTCLALADGGVACYGTIAGGAQGFVASPASVWTFG